MHVCQELGVMFTSSYTIYVRMEARIVVVRGFYCSRNKNKNDDENFIRIRRWIDRCIYKGRMRCYDLNEI